MIESKIGFPFHPLIGEKYKWTQMSRNHVLSPLESQFLSTITWTLGSES